MKRTYIDELKINENVLIQGFVQDVRRLSQVIFVIVRDVTGLVQCIVKKEDKCFEDVKNLVKESVVEIKGKVQKNNIARNGFELLISSIVVINEADPHLPINVLEKGDINTDLSNRMDWRFLDLRKREKFLIMKVSASFEKGMRNYWNKNNYIEIHSPKIIGTASESGAEVFTIPYFGKKAYLAQSPQFYKQMAMSAGFEKVFEISPVFRAEKSHTSRHVTEIMMIDMELSFIKDHFDIMKAEEELVISGLKQVKKDYDKEIKELYHLEIRIPKSPFPKISFEEANKIIKKLGGEVDEFDLTSEGEKIIGEWAKKEKKSDFLFVYEYPSNKKPFYHMYTDDGKHTKGFDLLYKGLEVTTGSQREHNYEKLKEQAIEKGLSIKPISDYLNSFRYGVPPHGGLGAGLARFVQQILNLDNVREAIFIPRDTERITP